MFYGWQNNEHIGRDYKQKTNFSLNSSSKYWLPGKVSYHESPLDEAFEVLCVFLWLTCWQKIDNRKQLCVTSYG